MARDNLLSPNRRILLGILILALALAGAATAHEPEYTDDVDRGRCTFASAGSNPYLPLWPGYALHYEGVEEDDEGELVEIEAWITVLDETERVDGVLTRVLEEREFEDGEIVEISRNWLAICRETGDVWYFGEDVDDFEDGEIVGHEGAWRAGENGAEPGILMPGNPLIGARYFQEFAPGVALDFGEVASRDAVLAVPAGIFEDLLYVVEGSALDPEDFSEKWYAPGVGLVKDDALELVDVDVPPCVPDATTHCLNDGRFKVEVEWEKPDGETGPGMAILPTDLSGEFYFFNPENTELIVKILDACSNPSFNSFWVFAAGLTDVEVTLTVTDTASGVPPRVYENPLGTDFAPILDTRAFATCP